MIVIAYALFVLVAVMLGFDVFVFALRSAKSVAAFLRVVFIPQEFLIAVGASTFDTIIIVSITACSNVPPAKEAVSAIDVSWPLR